MHIAEIWDFSVADKYHIKFCIQLHLQDSNISSRLFVQILYLAPLIRFEYIFTFICYKIGSEWITNPRNDTEIIRTSSPSKKIRKKIEKLFSKFYKKLLWEIS